MHIAKKLTVCVVAGSLGFAPISSQAQVPNLGGILAAVGGGGGGDIAGAIIGIAMSAMLQQLTAQELANRQASLQRAARSGSASWSTRAKHGSNRATYKRVGKVEQVGGQKCQKVKETITLGDGKHATSVENVCFS